MTTDQMRQAYAEYSARDFGWVDTMMAPDVHWKIVGFGEMAGREAVKEFFNGLTQQFDSHTITLDDSVEAGDRLICFVTHTFIGTHPVAAIHSWTSSGGQITSLYEVADTMAFAVAAGMMPQPA